MRKVAASAAVRKASWSAGGRTDASTEVVCAALALALLFLIARIASIW